MKLAVEDAASNAELVVDLDGFEGPIGMLLVLAREPVPFRLSVHQCDPPAGVHARHRIRSRLQKPGD